MREIHINCIDHGKETISFAADELAKYLGLVSDTEMDITVEKGKVFAPSEDDALWIGLYDDFSISSKYEKSLNEFDDGIYIDFAGGKGLIAGVNVRSVLLAVYRFLGEIGCMWVRPGKGGEVIQKKKIEEAVVQLEEKPSYRHRGVCIEGAVSLENVADMIDYLPKIGCNCYFIQFREAFTFFDRWYNHRRNPEYEPEGFSIEKCRLLNEQVREEISKRGLVFHAVGHGWTCECIGVSGLSWEPAEYDVNPEYTGLLAEIGGKRAIWEGIPLNTNLCYSNPLARKRMIDNIADYLLENKDVGILHFWLADAPNNQCECENCIKKSPTDFYVQMLNELDEKLTSLHIDTKVVFLLYFELLWKPEIERIKNPDRFILMFAPITRTYREALKPVEKEELPVYQRNRIKFSDSINESLVFLDHWMEYFQGDSFNFDYHLMWEHYYDPGQFNIARVLAEDVKNLDKIGLNGFVSCQVQRSFFPTGLAMHVMGRTLWNKEFQFAELAEEYFTASFGDNWKECMEYLDAISKLFDSGHLRANLSSKALPPDAGTAARLRKVPDYIEKFKAVIKTNLKSTTGNRRKSWEYLDIHSEYCNLFSRLLAARFDGNLKEAVVYWDELKDCVRRNEAGVQEVFDVFEFIEAFELIHKDMWQLIS